MITSVVLDLVLKSGTVNSANFSLFHIVLAIWNYVQIHINFEVYLSISEKQEDGILIGFQWKEHLGKYCHRNIMFSNP